MYALATRRGGYRRTGAWLRFGGMHPPALALLGYGAARSAAQLNMGVNGFDFGCRTRGSGSRSRDDLGNHARKPIGANSNRTAYALAA